jgi:hypothetical protein
MRAKNMVNCRFVFNNVLNKSKLDDTVKLFVVAENLKLPDLKGYNVHHFVPNEFLSFIFNFARTISE